MSSVITSDNAYPLFFNIDDILLYDVLKLSFNNYVYIVSIYDDNG